MSSGALRHRRDAFFDDEAELALSGRRFQADLVDAVVLADPDFLDRRLRPSRRRRIVARLGQQRLVQEVAVLGADDVLARVSASRSRALRPRRSSSVKSAVFSMLSSSSPVRAIVSSSSSSKKPPVGSDSFVFLGRLARLLGLKPGSRRPYDVADLGLQGDQLAADGGELARRS